MSTSRVLLAIGNLIVPIGAIVSLFVLTDSTQAQMPDEALVILRANASCPIKGIYSDADEYNIQHFFVGDQFEWRIVTKNDITHRDTATNVTSLVRSFVLFSAAAYRDLNLDSAKASNGHFETTCKTKGKSCFAISNSDMLKKGEG